MKHVESAGAVIFRERDDRREYLVMKNYNEEWEFPKGGIEPGEELQETALREIEEETGLRDIRLLNGFAEDYSYVFEVKGTKIHKTVYLFLGEHQEGSVSLSREHTDYQWRGLDEAAGTLSHEGPRNILYKADGFLNRRELESN